MRIALLLPLLVSACATFPTLEDSISPAAEDAPYPVLTPLPAIPTAQTPAQTALQARIDALQARAARLRRINIGALQ